MKPEIENATTIDFNYKTRNDIVVEMTKVDLVKETGLINRKSHSHYYGMLTQDPSGAKRFSTPEGFSPARGVMKKSTVHGYGVYASENIKMGEVIEEMFCIILDTTENTINDWVLNRYAEEWECDCDICKTNGKTLYLTSGYGMFYNHSQTPNAYLVLEKVFRRGRMIALRDITEGEEIFKYYGNNHLKVLDRQKNLDKRSDVAEGLPAAFGVGGKPCPIQPTQTIMKANDESMEFRGRTIE